MHILIAVSLTAAAATAQLDPLRYSVATPRPINPAEGTTNPSAQATQRQNPYLGSTPEKSTGGNVDLSLQAAVDRGLRYNLGLIESNEASADARAARLRALSALLPQISAHGKQNYEDLSLKEIGIKFPPIPGFPGLPSTTGGFGFQDARVAVSQSIYDGHLRGQYQAQKAGEQASALSIRDSRDVVVFAVASAYLQAIATAAKLESAKAVVASALELDKQTADRVKAEVSPEIDSLRAQVERQSAEQRVANLANQYEKDKLTLGRIIGFPVDQPFTLTETLTYRPLMGMTSESATSEALLSRSDVRSAEAAVRAAELGLRAERAQKLPVVSVTADYGGGGANIGNFNSVYTISGNISVPLYTGGRIQADVERASAELRRKQAEYEDLRGRIAYDVRVAWLDLQASESSVNVARQNSQLAARALDQSRDRYQNGVTNYIEVVQAEEVVAFAGDNYAESLYSFNLAKVSLARALGSADTRLSELSGGK